ncbi:MAG TPA: S41 family peptidase [Baekduia sp.]|uniref:S41 family peptidase n=1 Tax=Baekduia sp. TaxID=2600305 RepID=UPI002D774E59|nr:S41 family peptidase [Baekduia sp.]HET6506748.1 S41 family peptidase [Baekduia sp.]
MIRRAIASLVLCLVLLACGIYLGAHPSGLPGFVRDPLVGDSDTRVVNEAIDRVNSTYYRKISKKKLADSSIKGIVSSLDDRFSNYFTPEEYKKFNQQQNGEFAGIGVQVTGVAEGLHIVTVYAGSPARDAGIKVGDTITAVEGTPLKGKSQDAAVSLIQGRIGTPVKLTLDRDGTSRTVTVERATISVPVVESSERTVDGDKLEVIHLDQFSSGAHGEVAAALKKGIKDKVKGVVLDLRGNPGGLITEAQLVASQFLASGKIVTTKGRAVASRTFDATGDPTAPNLPLVVLVDHNSASAAEIVAGALQDRHRAELVGTRTFGKGVFQEVLELSNGGALDITAGQYFLPSGRNLGGAGVDTGAGLTPTVQASDNAKTKKDEALDKALDVLAGKVS